MECGFLGGGRTVVGSDVHSPAPSAACSRHRFPSRPSIVWFFRIAGITPSVVRKERH